MSRERGSIQERAVNDVLRRGGSRTSLETRELQLKNMTADFDCFSLALVVRAATYVTPPSYSSSFGGIAADFHTTEELAEMQSMTGTTTGSDLFTEVNTRLDKLTTTISHYIYIEIYSYMCMYVCMYYMYVSMYCMCVCVIGAVLN